MAELLEQWRQFGTLLRSRGLEWTLHRAPKALRVARHTTHPRGGAWGQLIPADYRVFVESSGYPVFGFRHYCRDGFSFLPPEYIDRLSVYLPDPDGNFPQRSDAAPTSCRFAFFAGYELAEVNGWAFGPGAHGQLVVWTVECGIPRREVGTYSEFLTQKMQQVGSLISGLGDDQVQKMRADNGSDNDPHLLIDGSLDKSYSVPSYSAEDLSLHWVEEQSGKPYSYGLFHDQQGWLLPMGKAYEKVKPFCGGVAEVVPYIEWKNGPKPKGKGEWRRIGLDGSFV